MIYLFDELDKIDNVFLDTLVNKLPKNRREKLGRYRLPKDRLLCCVSYYLLMYGLIKEKYYQYYMDDFQIGEDGKPYFDDGICFNFSHCDKGVACVISRDEVGIDIQDFDVDISNFNMDIVMSQNEIHSMQGCAHSVEKFVRYWTLKEGYYKCIGSGLVDEVNMLDFSPYQYDFFKYKNKAFNVYTYSSYVVSACGDFAVKEECNKVSLEEFKKVLNLL